MKPVYVNSIAIGMDNMEVILVENMRKNSEINIRKWRNNSFDIICILCAEVSAEVSMLTSSCTSFVHTPLVPEFPVWTTSCMGNWAK